jgi:hypothetical protein
MNGYSEEVEDALKFGKALNILLFDKNDMALILNGQVSFLKVLKFKLRQAGDTGSIQVPYVLKQKAKEISIIKPTEVSKPHEISIQNKDNQTIDDLLIFVEGRTDIPLINNFIRPIGQKYSLSYRIEVLEGAASLRNIPSLLNIYGDLKYTKGLIIILDDDVIVNQNLKPLIDNVEEQLKKSSIYINTQFLYFSETFKLQLSNEQKVEDFQNEPVFKQLENFINQIAEEYFDPVVDVPQEALHGAMSQLQWNFEGNVLEGTGEYEMPFEITTLEELIEHLENEIGLALNAEMPLEWLHSHDFDHRAEVQEFLLENWAKEIDEIGWDSGNL